MSETSILHPVMLRNQVQGMDSLWVSQGEMGAMAVFLLFS